MASPRMGLHVHVRLATWSDILELNNISLLSFGAHFLPPERIKQYVDRRMVYVAEGQYRTLGFLIRREVCRSVRILHIAVYPSWRRRNVAGRLIEEQIVQWKKSDHLRMFAEVPARNLPAVLCFRKFAFRGSILSSSNPEDCYLFERYREGQAPTPRETTHRLTSTSSPWAPRNRIKGFFKT